MIFKTKFLPLLATLTTLLCGAQTVTNTLLNVDYESGTLNSGISGLSPSHATAPDANYMVQPGATGNWAVAHKMVYGDSGYYSDAAYRSESDVIALSAGRYFPGDERRYEFSVMLKDWTPWVSGSTYETNIFQLKVSGNSTTDSGVPLQFRTARNALRLRYVGSTSITDIIPDLRPYVNQWLHFRVDVLWADGPTGYIRTSMKLPGQSNYTVVDEKTNYTSFAGDISIGNIGYVKWGGYALQEGLTRITYHDDIRIFELNNKSVAQEIWNNPITGSAVAFAAPLTTGNTTDPYIASDVNTAPSFFYGSTSSGLNAAGAFSNRIAVNGWTIKTSTTAPPTPFNPNQYFEFKVQPKAGYKINFSSFNFTARRGNVADPGMYVMRSNLDGFTNDITTPQTFSAVANIPTSLAIDLSTLPDTQEPITFRLYWYGTNRTGGVPIVGIDDFKFTGNIYKSIQPLQLQTKNDISKNTNNDLCTYTAQGNEFDVTAIGNCGNITYSYVLTGATTGSGNNSLANVVFNKGITTVDWTATDNCGSKNISFTTTVTDTIKPTIISPTAITLNNDTGQCGTTTTLSKPAVSDNCGVANIVSDAPATFPAGVTTVTWTVKDMDGNANTAIQTVTVIDAEAPVVNSTASVSLCNEASGNYTIPVATATDNCNISSATYQVTGATARDGNGLDASGNFNTGASTITWTVTDNAGNSSTTTTEVIINSIISASIADVYAVSPGGKANTIYLGYGPSSLTLTATPANGVIPYTYLWNNGATSASIMVNPSTPGVHSYTATITDALGCSITVTKQITVTDIRCAAGKVKVCHSSSPNHDKILCISTNGVAAHLAHGCYLDNCNSNNDTAEINNEETNEFMVNISSNPSKTEFKINVTGDPRETVSVGIFDLSGRRITLMKASPGQTITTGNDLIPGIYLAEITQGNNKKQLKLIKQ